jgi:hypothetical protein
MRDHASRPMRFTRLSMLGSAAAMIIRPSRCTGMPPIPSEQGRVRLK